MERILGCDTSFWNSKMDFTKMKSAGVPYCYTKTSQLYIDSRFKEYWPAMKDAGLLRGGYHYLDWRRSELDQAKLFIDSLNGDWGELPPVLDLEMNPAPYSYTLSPEEEFGMNLSYKKNPQFSPEHQENYSIDNTTYELSAPEVRGKVHNFLNYVEKATKRVPMIYSGFYYWRTWMTPDIAWKKYPFWLAWYEPEWYIKQKSGGTGAPLPWTDWTMWQYDGNGNGPLYGSQGLSMDMNWFNGSLDSLKRFAGGYTPVPTPVPTPIPVPVPVPNPIPLPIPGPATNYVAYNSPYNRLNVRATPSTAGVWVGYLEPKEVAYIDLGSLKNGYVYFKPTPKFPNGGWVFFSYLTKL